MARKSKQKDVLVTEDGLKMHITDSQKALLDVVAIIDRELFSDFETSRTFYIINGQRYELNPEKHEFQNLIKSGRAVGNTTRLVDAYIQKLFDNFGEEVEIRDHYSSRLADEHLVRIIVDRFKLEHQGVNIEVNRKKGFSIKISGYVK